VFSGDRNFAKCAHRFARLVAAIVRDKGFVVNDAKTRFMRNRTAMDVVTS
jgi:hypothetical protein